MFVFFYVAHPLVLFDSDDWEMCSYFRRPLPIFGGYNGMKVFPEVLFPALSEFSAFFIFPIVKDYLVSLSLTYAIVAAAAVTVYVCFFVRNVIGEEKKMVCAVLGMIFLALHFLILKNDWYGNEHLFYTQDVTCFFHYIVTGIFCSCIVMWFMTKKESAPEEEYKGIFYLILYLAVFSNMFTNIVLASYCGVSLLFSFVKDRMQKSALKETAKKNIYHIIVLIMWFAAMAIQGVDPRNADASKQTTEVLGIADVLGSMISYIGGMNKMFILCMAVIVAVSLSMFIHRNVKKEEIELLCKILLSGFLTFAYIVILSAVSNMYYCTRVDVARGFYFYMLLFFMTLLGMAIKYSDGKKQIITAILPLFSFVLIAQTVNSCKSYKEFNVYNIPKEQVIEVGNDILSQYRIADKEGLSNMELHVAEHSDNGNSWPYTFYVGDAISDTLVRHGIISEPIKCKVIYDPEKNEAFHLGF